MLIFIRSASALPSAFSAFLRAGARLQALDEHVSEPDRLEKGPSKLDQKRAVGVGLEGEPVPVLASTEDPIAHISRA
jgi:hypothetical protein